MVVDGCFEISQTTFLDIKYILFNNNTMNINRGIQLYPNATTLRTCIYQNILDLNLKYIANLIHKKSNQVKMRSFHYSYKHRKMRKKIRKNVPPFPLPLRAVEPRFGVNLVFSLELCKITELTQIS